MKVGKKDIIELRHHYEAITNLTKKRISLMNEEKSYMRITQSTVPEEVQDIVGWNGYQGYLEAPMSNNDANFVLPSLTNNR